MGQEENLFYFHRFSQDVSEIELPEEFTFPFCYEPHPLAEIAAKELQDYLEKQTDFQHNFGLSNNDAGLEIGKMFGVLVVQNNQNELGFLCAFSGKLANSNHHKYFVPPVFDLLDLNGFFLAEEEELNELNRCIASMEESSSLKVLKDRLNSLKRTSKNELADIKKEVKNRKKERDEIRKKLSENELFAKEEELKSQSIADSYRVKNTKAKWQENISRAEKEIALIQDEINHLKTIRKSKSADLQNRIFHAYSFLNFNQEERSLLSVFQQDVIGFPPAGAGECAAPKLLQFAYLNELKPIAMAEFWWGKSPLSEVRQHKNFYPACKGKCEPILGHMLKGLKVAPNPLLVNPAEKKELEIIYEDEVLILVNKPAEFLSVPGRTISDSVLSRLKLLYPEATGPILVHRLDMSTSGILIATKTEKAHKFVQKQFINRTIVKRYEALLDGKIANESGEIRLPLEQDYLNRPRQKVTKNGKLAITLFETITFEENKTRVYFYPKTGRTHQLRVHAAHQNGLNAPIVGDDLYGTKAHRLCLHAGYVKFIHPKSKEWITFEVKADF